MFRSPFILIYLQFSSTCFLSIVYKIPANLLLLHFLKNFQVFFKSEVMGGKCYRNDPFQWCMCFEWKEKIQLCRTDGSSERRSKRSLNACIKKLQCHC